MADKNVTTGDRAPWHPAGMKFLAVLLLAAPAVAHADPAVIENVDARPSSDGWHFAVTLAHGDTGWEDYADGWRVLAPDGTVLGTRVLAHPHVNEQPFTRSLSGVAIPAEMDEVWIESSTLPEGWGGQRQRVALSR